MQLIKENQAQTAAYSNPVVSTKRKQTGYRAIAAVIIQWEYAKKTKQTQPDTAF
jgi:hypothetical protein